MQDVCKVVIGIQARTGSHRFPNKVLETLGDKTIISHVISACQESARYINRLTDLRNITASVAVCIPEGDRLRLFLPGDVTVTEGPEQDVLTRYVQMAEKTKAHYVVRITGDCPLIPHFLISKHIMTAVKNGFDYLSNVDESCRTFADGWDCEVISAKALEFANQTATSAYDREHVTTILRSQPASQLSRGVIVGRMDLSHLKLSLDTPEDLERIREAYAAVEKARGAAQALYGARNVHRY